MQIKEYNVFAASCISHKLLDIIGNKWIMLLLHKLAQRTHRFGELQREVGGISKKMLTQQLRLLEQHGLIQRQQFDETVLRVEYSLTELGYSLSDCCRQLNEWVENNIDKIEAFKQQTTS